jgi:hypothetical protein
MGEFLNSIVVFAFLFFFVLFLVSQLMMITNRKSGVKLFDASLFGNPFAIQFYGQKYLTDRGLFWRNVSWLGAIGFVLSILALLSTKPG